jgi:hypothetical protein
MEYYMSTVDNVLKNDEPLHMVDRAVSLKHYKAIEAASELADDLGMGIRKVAHEGHDWLLIPPAQARIAVHSMLMDQSLPCTDTSHYIYESHYPKAVRLDFFKTHFHELVMNVASRNTKEADVLVDVVSSLNKMSFAWPESDADTIGFVEYLVLLTKQKDQLVFDRKMNIAWKLTHVSIRRTMSGRVLAAYGEALLPMGKRIAQVNISHREGEFLTAPLGEMRLVPMTPEILAKLAAQGKEKHQEFMAEEISYRDFKDVGYIPGFMGSKMPVSVDSRVIIDPAGCREMEPSRFNSLLALFDISIDEDDDEEVQITGTDSDFARLIKVGVFFNLSKSHWFVAQLDKSTPIKFRSDAFEHLVLDPKLKKMIKAIAVHRAGDIDLISGKGGGAIFLLNGVPGTGKTLTAEAVAEVLEKPLYKVGLGDLGTDVEVVEERLGNFLKFAERWNACLLFDEADTMMEKRDINSLQRNAMVAIFLRLLEYYTGVLFLTTNRGQNIDEAFQSRVTLAIHYEDLDEDGLRKIWTGRLAANNYLVKDGDIERLLTYKTNGREVKNAISSGISLAMEEGVQPNVSHLIDMLEVSKTFKKGLCAE